MTVVVSSDPTTIGPSRRTESLQPSSFSPISASALPVSEDIDIRSTKASNSSAYDVMFARLTSSSPFISLRIEASVASILPFGVGVAVEVASSTYLSIMLAIISVITALVTMLLASTFATLPQSLSNSRPIA